MRLLKAVFLHIILAAIILGSLALQAADQDWPLLKVSGVMIIMLSAFSVLSLVLWAKGAAIAREIRDRTMTWWWMVAVFLLAISTDRLAVMVLIGGISFMALREYFGLLPNRGLASGRGWFRDRLSVWLCYAAIPMSIWLAYIKWYETFIILVPVYFFLLIPVVFVLQNRTSGTIRALGYISIGLMFFVFCLGHGLFMVNLGGMVLLYCFFLTELRDLLSYWVGKGLNALGERCPKSCFWSGVNAKIAPSVSPKKSWGAGLLTAGLIAGVSTAFVPLFPRFPDGVFDVPFAIVVGFMIGLLGLMGDLVFSMIKRDLGTKDSGTLLPGHGGMIDRVDSLVLTVPITFHLIFWRYF